nr:putative retrotransposon protein [Tanacetum cinerariifolium]
MTWKSSKRDIIADSTCKSEYIVACEASKEAIWMKNFIRDLGVVPTVQDPIKIFSDNESEVALTKEPKDHGKSKHIKRKYHFVISKVEEGHTIMKHIRSEDNPADPFTKALAKLSIKIRHIIENAATLNPGEGHWTAVKNILKYLRNTKDKLLVYGEEEELRLTGYCDASWQTDKDDSRSHSGCVFLLNRGAMTWKSSKQDIIADSTCESEYIVACEASKEAIWMKNFIGDLRVVPTVQDPIKIFSDNESEVALTKEPKDHGKLKHIKRKYHFVISKVEEGHAIMKHIRSEDNPADPFTKALAKSRHDEHARSIGLKDNIKF